MATTPELGVPRELAAPHEPRPCGFLRRERAVAWRLAAGGWRLYGIALPGREVRAELLDAAMELAP